MPIPTIPVSNPSKPRQHQAFACTIIEAQLEHAGFARRTWRRCAERQAQTPPFRAGNHLRATHAWPAIRHEECHCPGQGLMRDARWQCQPGEQIDVGHTARFPDGESPGVYTAFLRSAAALAVGTARDGPTPVG
jgi:hypothetical protein